MARPPSSDPKHVVLDGPGPFQVATAVARPFLLRPTAEGKPIRIGLTLRGGKQLLIPIEWETFGLLRDELDRFLGPKKV